MIKRLVEIVSETSPIKRGRAQMAELREVSRTKPTIREVDEIPRKKEVKMPVREVETTRETNVLVSIQAQPIPQEPTQVEDVASENLTDVIVRIARESSVAAEGISEDATKDPAIKHNPINVNAKLAQQMAKEDLLKAICW